MSSCYFSRAKRCPTYFAMATILVCSCAGLHKRRILSSQTFSCLSLSSRHPSPSIPISPRVQDTGLSSPTSLLGGSFLSLACPQEGQKTAGFSLLNYTPGFSARGWGEMRGTRARCMPPEALPQPHSEGLSSWGTRSWQSRRAHSAVCQQTSPHDQFGKLNCFSSSTLSCSCLSVWFFTSALSERHPSHVLPARE